MKEIMNCFMELQLLLLGGCWRLAITKIRNSISYFIFIFYFFLFFLFLCGSRRFAKFKTSNKDFLFLLGKSNMFLNENISARIK